MREARARGQLPLVGELQVALGERGRRPGRLAVVGIEQRRIGILVLLIEQCVLGVTVVGVIRAHQPTHSLPTLIRRQPHLLGEHVQVLITDDVAQDCRDTIVTGDVAVHVAVACHRGELGAAESLVCDQGHPVGIGIILIAEKKSCRRRRWGRCFGRKRC